MIGQSTRWNHSGHQELDNRGGWRRKLMGIFLISLTACQHSQSTIVHSSTPYVSHSTPSSVPTSSSVTSQDVSFTPTAILVEIAIPSTPENTPLPTLSPASNPLHIVFPTPAPGLVSAWRPPLYPIPWAPTSHDHFYFARPIAADQVNWPAADYRYGGIFFEDVVHTGVDIPAPKYTPVLAAGPGKVVWAGYGVYRGGHDESDPYGLAVTIRHDFGYQDQILYTLYGHLDQIDVVVGQHVETGEPIGLVGETGKVTGPHLHFEVRLSENDYFTTRNPELWLSPPQGWGILVGRVMDYNGSLIKGQYITVSDANGRNWFAKTYGAEAVNSDPYYRENLVIGDLPAGEYTIRTAYGGVYYTMDIRIDPGLVSYFMFWGQDGFEIGPPPTPLPIRTPTPTP